MSVPLAVDVGAQLVLRCLDERKRQQFIAAGDQCPSSLWTSAKTQSRTMHGDFELSEIRYIERQASDDVSCIESPR